jgi:tRNA (adenine37-N6)-methyltransferase
MFEECGGAAPLCLTVLPVAPGMPDLTLRPIGVLHTPFPERKAAPRQSYVAKDAVGTIVLEPGRGFEHALEDVGGWERLWVLYWFHLNDGWRPKVLPPRSKVRRGVFATRSPHRPNPIGMSVVELLGVEGLTLHVRGLDMLDGTPVLDLKPYVATADAFPDAGSGWLSTPDPIPAFGVIWSKDAKERVDWLRSVQGHDLKEPVEAVLTLGPEPHPYRRIRRTAAGLVLAVKDWRVRFEEAGERRLRVTAIWSGYRPRELATGQTLAHDLHREFVARFPAG